MFLVNRKKATDRKREVLSFLKTASANAGSRFPTPEELHAAFGEGGKKPRVVDHQLAMQKRRRRRAIDDQPNPARMTILPILGAIPAGFGEPVDSTELGSIPVDLVALSIKTTSRTFALKVRGDSMVGAHIADGDLVVVEVRKPKAGDVVAALIDGETTLKRFVCEDGKFFLKAENPLYPDLIPLQELTIQGVARAVVRVCERTRAVL